MFTSTSLMPSARIISRRVRHIVPRPDPVPRKHDDGKCAINSRSTGRAVKQLNRYGAKLRRSEPVRARLLEADVGDAAVLPEAASVFAARCRLAKVNKQMVRTWSRSFGSVDADQRRHQRAAAPNSQEPTTGPAPTIGTS